MSSRFLLTALSGWTLIVLLALTIRLAYRLRLPLATAAGRALPPRPRMRLHYWLGYSIAALALVHSGAPMTPGLAGAAHRVGLQLASLALLLVFFEVGLGLWLRRRPRRRATVRRVHFWTMTALVALVVVHVGLDSALLGTFRLRRPLPRSAPGGRQRLGSLLPRSTAPSAFLLVE